MGLFDWVGRTLRRPARVEEPVNEANPPDEAEVPSKEDLLTPRARFQGEFSPENLAFDSNLQEFAQRVAYICGLETAGKIKGDEAHRRIRHLYEQLARTHEGLGIGKDEKR
ncbi:MAG: hypothetical protein R2720_02130 [Candidatus Nanopelagicales bacterium]